jgi:hypothetical protein
LSHSLDTCSCDKSKFSNKIFVWTLIHNVCYSYDLFIEYFRQFVFIYIFEENSAYSKSVYMVHTLYPVIPQALEFRTPFFLIWSLPRLWYGSLSGSISLNHLSIFYNSLVLLTFVSRSSCRRVRRIDDVVRYRLVCCWRFKQKSEAGCFLVCCWILFYVQYTTGTRIPDPPFSSFGPSRDYAMDFCLEVYLWTIYPYFTTFRVTTLSFY